MNKLLTIIALTVASTGAFANCTSYGNSYYCDSGAHGTVSRYGNTTQVDQYSPNGAYNSSTYNSYGNGYGSSTHYNSRGGVKSCNHTPYGVTCY